MDRSILMFKAFVCDNSLCCYFPTLILSLPNVKMSNWNLAQWKEEIFFSWIINQPGFLLFGDVPDLF